MLDLGKPVIECLEVVGEEEGALGAGSEAEGGGLPALPTTDDCGSDR